MVNETEITTTAAQPGILDTVKEKVHFSDLVEKINDSRSIIMDMALYGGIGFLSGYLLKKYSNAVIIIILMTTALVVLQQFEFITVIINWPKIHSMLGLQENAKIIIDNFGLFFVDWVKSNMPIVVVTLIGFLLGIKVA